MRSLASSTILFLHLNVLILGDDMSVVVPMSHGLKYPPFEIAENMGAGRLCLLVSFTTLLFVTVNRDVNHKVAVGAISQVTVMIVSKYWTRLLV